MQDWLQFLSEGVASAQIVPLSSQPLFFALRSFGARDLAAPAVWVAVGTAAGHIVNWLIGRLLLIARARGHFQVSDRAYLPLRDAARTFGLPLLLFTWYTFGSLIPLVFGFLNVPLKRVLPVIFIGQLGYFLYFAFN